MRMTPRRISQTNMGFHGAHTDESSGEDSSYIPRPMTSIKRRRKSSLSHASSTRSNHPHILTKHNYHDRSIDPEYDVVFENTPYSSRTTSPVKGGTSMPFPVKLYEMLIQVEDEGLSHVVSWQPHGRCFVVHNAQAFKLLLPNYFKLSKIASFQRQLNLYGFQRLTVGCDKGGYYNELFLRNRADLVLKIHRVKVKGTGVRAKSNPKEEPNLYLYPAVDQLAESVVSSDQGATEKQEFSSAHQTMLSADVVPRDLSSSDEERTDESMYKTCPTHVFGNIDSRRKDANASVLSEALYPSRALNDSSNSLGMGNAVPKLKPEAIVNVVSPEDIWEVDVTKSAVSFDRLIDEMFSHNQSLDFSDLLKLASS